MTARIEWCVKFRVSRPDPKDLYSPQRAEEHVFMSEEEALAFVKQVVPFPSATDIVKRIHHGKI